jgi:transcription elongation factor GreA
MPREVKLTPEGYERLRAELEHERVRLAEATRILQELMESSDDYDDSGLEDAKREKSRIEARIDSLEDTLSRAVLLGPESTDVVGLGTLVTLTDGGKVPLKVRVVSPAEASTLEQPMRIADDSPLGKALLGRRTGDKIWVDTPRGKKEYQVEALSD